MHLLSFVTVSNLIVLALLFVTSSWPDYETLPLCTRGLQWDETTMIPFDEIFTAAPKDAISLLRSILVLDPNMRLDASQSLSHPYFSNDPPPTSKQNLVLTA
jgi:cyclin-dependent kinase 7